MNDLRNMLYGLVLEQKEINNLYLKLEEIENDLVNVDSIRYDIEKVQSSNADKYLMETLLDEKEKTKKELKDKIDLLNKKRVVVSKLIENLDDLQIKKLLIYRYLFCESWAKIYQEMHPMSESRIWRLHRTGIELLNKEYEKTQ